MGDCVTLKWPKRSPVRQEHGLWSRVVSWRSFAPIKRTELRLGEFSLLALVVSQLYAPRSRHDYPGFCFFLIFFPSFRFLSYNSSPNIYSFPTVLLKTRSFSSYFLKQPRSNLRRDRPLHSRFLVFTSVPPANALQVAKPIHYSSSNHSTLYSPSNWWRH
jgi:hypothetical protein